MSIQRACVVCGAISDKGRCPAHRRKAWEGSTRRQRTISGWAQQKRARAVIERDDGICHVCGYAGADQADHVVPLTEGGTDDASNMAAIHRMPCHSRKTQEEASRGRAHPGG